MTLLLLVACEAVVDLTPEVPWSGVWAGRVEAQVDFPDGEEGPYCSGDLLGSAEPMDGRLLLEGSCVIQWGPYRGETLATRFDGVIEDDQVGGTLDVVDEERSFSPVDLEGPCDARGIELEGEANYLASTGSWYPASLRVLAERQPSL